MIRCVTLDNQRTSYDARHKISRNKGQGNMSLIELKEGLLGHKGTSEVPAEEWAGFGWMKRNRESKLRSQY